MHWTLHTKIYLFSFKEFAELEDLPELCLDRNFNFLQRSVSCRSREQMFPSWRVWAKRGKESGTRWDGLTSDRDVKTTLCLLVFLLSPFYLLKAHTPFNFLRKKTQLLLVTICHIKCIKYFSMNLLWRTIIELSCRQKLYISDRNERDYLLSETKRWKCVGNLTRCQSQSEPTWARGDLPQDGDSIILDTFHPIAIYKKYPPPKQKTNFVMIWSWLQSSVDV